MLYEHSYFKMVSYDSELPLNFRLLYITNTIFSGGFADQKLWFSATNEAILDFSSLKQFYFLPLIDCAHSRDHPSTLNINLYKWKMACGNSQPQLTILK